MKKHQIIIHKQILLTVIIFFLISLSFSSLTYAQSQLGEKAPGFITNTLDGKRIALKDYWENQEKKVLILSFFATWCGPCKEDLKYLQKVQDQHSSKGLQVVSVLTQDSSKEEAVRRFTQTLGVRLPVLLDEFSIIGRRYGVTGLPCTFVIDKEGILKGKYLGYSEVVKRKFEDLLKEIL
jgi:cytochrome c biogenesis protein CcmG/thiol:disulfide interchange protein DsbE